MFHMHREIVENWLWWSVMTLAMRRTDVERANRTAQLALIQLWNNG